MLRVLYSVIPTYTLFGCSWEISSLDVLGTLEAFTSICTTVDYVIKCLATGLMYVMMRSALIVLIILLHNCTCALVLMHLNNLIAQHHRLGLIGYGFAQILLRLDKAAKRGNNNMHTL